MQESSPPSTVGTGAYTAGSSRTSPTPEGLSQEASRLEQHLLRLKRVSATGRWILGLSTLIIVLEFAIFSYAVYERIHQNFSPVSVQQAVNSHGDQVLPLASNLLIETGRNSMPVYRDAILAAVHKRGPGLANETVARFERVPEETGKSMQQKLQATFDDVMKRIQPDLKQAFPNLSDEKRQQLMQVFVADQIDEQNKRLAAHISQLYTNDLIRMQAVLEKFDLPDATQPSMGQTALAQSDDSALEHRFLHSLVALLDDQLDSAYSGSDANGTSPMLTTGVSARMTSSLGGVSTGSTTKPAP